MLENIHTYRFRVHTYAFQHELIWHDARIADGRRRDAWHALGGLRGI